MFALAVSTAPASGSGILGLFLESGWVGKVIVVILLLVSVVTWAMILLKYQYLRRAERESLRFTAEFRKTKSVQEIMESAGANTYSPVATLFVESYKEAEAIIKALPEGRVAESDRITIKEELERSLTITTQDEINYMERYLAFLGTAGTVGPLLGLFGTVWGIMDAFYAIGLKGSGDIAALAPGLAEALINTCMGLFVAIPSVIAYNYFSEKIRSIATRMDSFSLECVSFIDRTLIRRKS